MNLSVLELEKMAMQIRRDIIRMTNGAGSGHPGGSLGCADFFPALFFNVMDAAPEKFTMEGGGEDMFFLSNGHITPVLYSTMARRGYFPLKELDGFRKLNSKLQGHPSNAKGLSGIRMASGSLGQGVSVACGAALAKKTDNDEHLVWVLTGDGELQEGQIWEALMFATAKKLDNLILTVDYNQKQIDGPLDKVLDLGNLKSKFAAFGWEVMEMNGNVMKDVLEGLHQAKSKTKQGKPVAVIMHTEMGCGVDFMMGTHKWHGTPPNAEQAEKALAQLQETLGDY